MLVVAAVADDATCSIEAAVQGGLRHDPPAPHRRQQVVLADNSFSIADQVEKHIEDLRLDVDRFATARQFAPRRMEDGIAEQKAHRRFLRDPGRPKMASIWWKNQDLPGDATLKDAPVCTRCVDLPHIRRSPMKAALQTLAIGVVAVASVALTASAETMDEHKIVSAQEIKWGPAPPSIPPGAQAAVLYGDPGKEGLFSLRLKLPKDYAIPPHTHPKPEVVTVISGTFRLGMGERADKSKGQALPAGSFFA